MICEIREQGLVLIQGWGVWALCEQADRGRVVKGSIETLIIDKHEGEGDGGEWKEEREGGVEWCSPCKRLTSG